MMMVPMVLAIVTALTTSDTAGIIRRAPWAVLLVMRAASV